ncbi:MAG: VanZ family protein [Clostridia bacterium]|nr:VanZ family protein [Clostridia bacterium]
MKEKLITKKNVIRIILIVLLLGIACVIFAFSSQNGQKSTGLSRAVTQKVTQNIKQIQKLEPQEKEVTLLKIEAIIRKLAHFSIYTLMGLLLMSFMKLTSIKEKNKILLSISIGTVYAILDEIHQLFTPERTARILDVAIDTSRHFSRNSNCNCSRQSSYKSKKQKKGLFPFTLKGEEGTGPFSFVP